MIIDKPWGSEEVLEINENYLVKRLVMKAGHRCSLQYHNQKCETIYVLSGELKITLDDTDRVYKTGESITIEPKQIHRMEGVTDSVYLEASTPQMDDVVRLSDDYNRAAL